MFTKKKAKERELLPAEYLVEPSFKFDLYVPRIETHPLYRQMSAYQISPSAFMGDKNHHWLYVLKLSGGNIYVGMTANINPYNRIKMHFNGLGAKWTRMHQPIDVIEIRDLGECYKWQAEDVEEQLTMHYSKEYGEKKVRGGIRTDPVYRGPITKFLEGYGVIIYVIIIILLMLFLG